MSAHTNSEDTPVTSGDIGSEVTSTFQRRPCYRYIRHTDKLPTYEQLGDRPFTDIVCKVRLFNPTGRGTWWLATYDPGTGIAWGVADIIEREVGDIGMHELVAFRGVLGLPIERDLYYTPVSMAAVLEGGR
jgi:hypothetical protein